MQSNKDDYLIERFELDPSQFEELADLIKISFTEGSEVEGGTIAFTKDTLNFMFGSPYLPKSIFVRTVYKPTGEVVGFLGEIPRPLTIEGKIYNIGIPSWAAVHYKHQKKGLATLMGKKLLEIGQTMDFDGGIAMFEPEEHGIDTGKAFSKNSGIPMREILRINKFLIRVFDIKRTSKAIKLKWFEKLGLGLLQGLQKVNNPRVRKFRKEDGERLYELMADHQKNNQISIIRNHDDFLWYLQQPKVNCVVHEDENGVVDGFILAWEFIFAGFGHFVPFGWLDLVHTYRLSQKEAADLCKYLCVTSKELGWGGLQCPFIPYFDVKPFNKSKFVAFPKILLIDLFELNKIPMPEKIDSFYFDWR